MRAQFVFENINKDLIPLRDKLQGRLLKFQTTWYHGGPSNISIDSLKLVRDSKVILNDGREKKSGSNMLGNIGFYVTPDALRSQTENSEPAEKYARQFGKDGIIYSITISDKSKFMSIDEFKNWMVIAKRSDPETTSHSYKSVDGDKNIHIDMRNLQAREIQDFLSDGWHGIVRYATSIINGKTDTQISELVILNKDIIKEIKPVYHQYKDLYSLTIISKGKADVHHEFSKKHFAVPSNEIKSIFQSFFDNKKYKKGGKHPKLGQLYWGDVNNTDIGIGITKSQHDNFVKIK